MPKVKSVIDYSGLNFNEVMDLQFDLFQLMAVQAFILNLMQTAEGQQYLADCERYKNTECDIEGLKRLFNKTGGDNKC